MRSGRSLALWRDQLGQVPPYDIGPDSLFVCYSGTEAELACHLALGWLLPEHVVDLIVEYRMAINGVGGDQSLGLLSACARLSLPVRTSPDEKRRARDRVLQGWPFSAADRSWILQYCVDDVAEEAALLEALSPAAAGLHAVWRGRFIKAVARAWWRGVPVDRRYAALATDHGTRLALRQHIIDDIGGEFSVFDGPVLKNARLAEWLEERHIPVPRTPTGRAAVPVDDLARLARDHPVLAPFVEAQRTLSQLKDFSLPIGRDNRLRAWFAPFMTATSRAAPPTNGYIYNLPAWTSAIMQPPPGRALIYLDWQAMEFGLAAALSGDATMREFYRWEIPISRRPRRRTQSLPTRRRRAIRTSGMSSRPACSLRSTASARRPWRAGCGGLSRSRGLSCGCIGSCFPAIGDGRTASLRRRSGLADTFPGMAGFIEYSHRSTSAHCAIGLFKQQAPISCAPPASSRTGLASNYWRQRTTPS